MTAHRASKRGVTYTARRHAAARRVRYTHHSKARFVPLATVPLERHTARPEAGLTAQTAPSAEASESSDDDNPRGSRSGPAPAEVSASQTQESPETDTEPATGTDPARAAVAGNPLAAPPVAEHAVAPPSEQVAELHVPRVFGRYALRGTHDSLVRQNQRVEDEDLQRIEDDADLQSRIAGGFLVPVPESSALMVNPALPQDRRYCRPWTADFLGDLSRAHESQFHKPLVVSSAVRTVEYQKRLMRINRNAADAEGDIVSPHLTGATIDIAKSGLSRREMQWMRSHLLAYQNAGLIDVEEEFRQRCFHITVYRSYSPATSSRNTPTEAPRGAAPGAPAAGSEAVSKDE